MGDQHRQPEQQSISVGLLPDRHTPLRHRCEYRRWCFLFLPVLAFLSMGAAAAPSPEGLGFTDIVIHEFLRLVPERYVWVVSLITLLLRAHQNREAGRAIASAIEVVRLATPSKSVDFTGHQADQLKHHMKRAGRRLVNEAKGEVRRWWL